jgi:pSer/pThr/pTyr-binding forkhead associated (FHA) protein
MSENSIWNSIGKLWKEVVGNTTPGGSTSSGHRCPAGHLMDPNWETCPYCEAEKRARDKTAYDPPDQTIERSSNMPRNPTMTPGDAVQSPGRGQTRVDTSADSSPVAENRRTDTRKITGVLVTFTWRPEGELFVIREGKNFIGSGPAESEGGRPCDVQITTDSMLSNEHAVILCRAGRYELFDRQSTNGTFLDDQFVGGQGAEVPDRAKIKTGATVWSFLKIESGAAGVYDTVDDVVARPVPRDRPRRGETDVP